MKLRFFAAAAMTAMGILLGGCSNSSTRVLESDVDVVLGSTAAETTCAPQAEAAATQSDDNGQEPIQSPAAAILSQMSVEEKVGQMIIAACPDNGAQDAVSEYSLGGFILFAQDFKSETPDSVRSAIESYQQAADIPLLIAVDEEGGDIVRVSKFSQFRSEPFGAPMQLYTEGGIDAVIADAEEKSALLRSLGINMNLAPVCDLARSEHDYIYDRTFGTDCAAVCSCINAVVSQMNSDGMISSLKHFPGYGDNADTHTGIAFDDRPLSEFRELDLLPFSSGIDAGAPCIMVSHNIVSSMDAELPASLSPEVHRILREELGFEGVIMTDELTMGAISSFIGSESAAVLAVKAGNDMLCINDYAKASQELIEAVSSGEITEQRLDESVMKILEMKINYGIIN